MLRLHVCRANFGTDFFFRATNFPAKNASKCSPKFLSLCLVGTKNDAKFLPNVSPNFLIDLKNHRRASAGVQGEPSRKHHLETLGSGRTARFCEGQRIAFSIAAMVGAIFAWSFSGRQEAGALGANLYSCNSDGCLFLVCVFTLCFVLTSVLVLCVASC